MINNTDPYPKRNHDPYYYAGDIVIIKESGKLKKELYNQRACVLDWEHDDIYTVMVEETKKEIVLHEKEMFLASRGNK